MNNPALTIRGLACPYNKAPIDTSDERLAVVRPGAFLTAGLRNGPINAGICPLQFGLHGGNPIASTLDRSLRLFDSALGLMFEAQLGWRHVATASAIRREQFGCSIEFAELLHGIEWEGSELVRPIVRARVGHVALVHEPAYAETAAWLAEQETEDTLPPRIRNLASAWHRANTKSPLDARRNAHSAVA